MLRTLLFDQQWCMLHYPEQPNGFAIFIIGDQQHYVNEESSFWINNIGRKQMIERLTQAGYFVYYSNLFEKNWGNQQSVEHSYNLYQLIMRKEILNQKIHILAEGMGILTAAQLIPLMEDNIRSIVLFAPCISLEKHIEQEQTRKFYYKKLMKEIKAAFNEESVHINTEKPIEEMKESLFIIQVIDQNRYKDQLELIHQLLLKRKEKKLPVEIHYILLENRQYITEKIIRFLKENEKVL
ncbi:hydrolase [Heyndrickxia sporothermodurans]|uniref:hydrolase n=1 Tax=Heyndrickxia sporothermodurans TaxID=46224 RepID=UPI0035E22F20